MDSGNDHERLEKLIRAGSKQDCLDFFKGKSVEERRTFAKTALKKFKDADGEWKQRDNASVCILATATLGELKNLGWQALPQDGFVLDVVRALELGWANDWAQHLLDDEPHTYRDIRRLYEAGLCDKPMSDGYTLGMISRLPGSWEGLDGRDKKNMTLVDRIRTTPDIRDEDIWRLFEVEGGGEVSLAAFDKYIGRGPSGGWASALVELAADGTLSRDRLLDSSLSALERDFAQFRAGWFSRFHEQLAPTLEERAVRRNAYLRLLGSSVPPTVSFALKAIGMFDKANRLPPDDLLAHIRPVLQARAKGTVTTGLRMLAQAAKREPDVAIPAARIAVDALLHEAADVQAKVLDLIESLGGQSDAGLRDAMQVYADGIAPSVRDRFAALTGLGAATLVDTEPSRPRVQSKSEIKPIASFDELNSEWLRVLEDPSAPLDIERVLDGLSRWGAKRPDEFAKAVGPLAKRAKAIIDRQPDDRLQYLMAWLASGYTADTSFKQLVERRSTDAKAMESAKKQETGSLAEVFAYRTVELMLQIENGHRLPMIGAPSDSRGFVSVEALLSRYAEYKSNGVKPGMIDMALALLRLAPEGRAHALELFEPKDEVELAIAFALGGDVPIGKTGWLWVAAAAARRPYEDQPAVASKHGRGLPDAGTKARYEIGLRGNASVGFSTQPKISGRLPEGYITSRFHVCAIDDWYMWSACGHVNMIRWSSTVWPLNLEPFFFLGLRFFRNDQRLANSPYAGFLEPMLQEHVVIGEVGSALLALGLTSIDPAVRGVALEGAIASISEDRISLQLLQQALIGFTKNRTVPVGRWTKALGEISTHSLKHANFVRDLIAGSLRHDPSAPPRDIGGLVELLYELTVLTKTPVDDARTIEYLQGVRGGGKLKRFASLLLVGR